MVVLKKIKHFFSTYYLGGRELYRVEKIDLKAQQVLVHMRGKAAIWPLSFSDALSDHALISGLSCDHACWLGFYYGRVLRASREGRARMNVGRRHAYLISYSQGAFRVVGQDREGRVSYVEDKRREVLKAYPVSLVQNEYVLAQFDPSAACYIGLLAGMAYEKSKARKHEQKEEDIVSKFREHPTLRVVN